MDFVEIVKRTQRELYDASEKNELAKLGRFLDRTKTMTQLLSTDNPIVNAFTTENMFQISMAYQSYQEWRDAYKNTRRELTENKLALPDETLQNAAFPHELATLVRTAKMCPRSGYADLSSWTQAVSHHLVLWNNCLKEAREQGTITTEFIDDANSDNARFEAYILNAQIIDALESYKWQGVRRGEKSGVLKVSLNLPEDVFKELTQTHLPNLGTAAQQREPAGILQELVLDHIHDVLLKVLDNEAENHAITTAREAYKSLLSLPPADTETYIGIYVGSSTAPVGVVAMNKKGKTLAHTQMNDNATLAQSLSDFITNQSADAVVIPVQAADQARFKIIEELVDSLDITVERVLPNAIKIARERIKAPAPIASAAILVLRKIVPAVEWGKVPASEIGLGEFSSDLDAQRLDSALEETRLITLLEQKREKTGFKESKLARKKRRLNPMVKNIMDLKPGMHVDGLITNLTKFGAFVNIGLMTEAMIHVSQLSTDYIEQPSQLVKVGQAVNARILEVIPEKGRIALSLKPENAPMPNSSHDSQKLKDANTAAAKLFRTDFDNSGLSKEEGAPTSGGSPGHKPKEEVKKSRSEALADLDALFNK